MTTRARSREQPTPPRPPVAVKGSREGLRIIVREAADDSVTASLQEQLARRGPEFFRGATAVLEMPAGPLDVELVARVAEILEDAGMELHGISAGPPAQERAPSDASSVRNPQLAPTAALLVQRTLRSGQRVVHDGAVVVLGDINPGAEVLAGGSVIVWGHLRGTVEAGLSTDGAVVCALDLSPTQLRIGQALARAPEEPEASPEPEVACERDGRIVVDTWLAAEPWQT